MLRVLGRWPDTAEFPVSAYKRNEIERFVTDWEFREYAYHL
jgi:hypothetical protein